MDNYGQGLQHQARSACTASWLQKALSQVMSRSSSSRITTATVRRWEERPSSQPAGRLLVLRCRAQPPRQRHLAQRLQVHVAGNAPPQATVSQHDGLDADAGDPGGTGGAGGLGEVEGK